MLFTRQLRLSPKKDLWQNLRNWLETIMYCGVRPLITSLNYFFLEALGFLALVSKT